MIRFRKFLALMAIPLIGAAILGAPTQARAQWSVEVIISGASSGNGTFAATVAGGGYSYGTTTGSTPFYVTGTLLESDILGALITVGNNAQIEVTTTSGGGTIQILATYQGFMVPNSTTVRLSSSTTSSTLGSDNVGTMTVGANYYGVLSSTNALYTLPTGSNNTPLMTGSGSISGVGNTGTLPLNPATATAVVSSAAPFSLTSDLTYTITASGDINGDTVGESISTAASAIPAPAGLILALTGLPCLGLGRWLRRRTKVA